MTRQKKGRNEAARISFGQMQVDWETRIDYEKMRKERLQRARDAMNDAKVDFLILLRQENARYTTGIKRLYWPTIHLGGGPIVVLPQEGLPAVWITDPDFASKSLSWIPKERFLAPHEMDMDFAVENFAQEVKDLFGSALKKATIGVDIWSPSMVDLLSKKLPQTKFVNGQKVMLQARMTKTKDELDCMKMAYVISEAGMQAALNILKPGVRECELVGAAFHRFTDFGSETSQCSQSVNSGPGSHPYRRFHSDRIIQAGDFVNMDFGACFNGYFGDFCRPFVCGRRPSPKQLDLLRRAYDLQTDAIQAIRPGLKPAELCKKLGRKNVAHGIGISAFEPPSLRASDEITIRPGMVFCVTSPMGIGDSQIGGVHLEDNVIVTENGCEVYSTYPYTGVDDI